MSDISQYIDHTLLKPEASSEQISNLCNEADEYNFKSVCVNPYYVKQCAEMLFGKSPLVCTVIGFPLGANTTESKVFETVDAIKNGADEIDMVINIGSLISNDLDYLKQDIAAVLKVTREKGKLLKVIFETSKLDLEQIEKASKVCKELEVDFVKTSTGFGGGGATIEHVKLMRKIVGDKIGVKASGGVRDQEAAMNMIEAGATRIGTSSGLNICN